MVKNLDDKMLKVMGIAHIKGSEEPAKFLPENLSLLLGHDFNKKASLRSVFNTRYTATIMRESGELTVNIPSFNPANCIIPPKQATHFQFIITGAEIDFEKQEQKHKTFRSEAMKINNLTGDISIIHHFTPASKDVLFIALGIFFIDETGTYYSSDVEAKKVNALCIVQLDLP